MKQLDDITVTDRSGRTADHQLLSDRERETGWTGTTSPSMPRDRQVTYLLGSLMIHQLLTSLKG